MLNLYAKSQVKKLENKLILKKYLDKNDIKDICPALFLDRDGVIIKDCHYISSPEKVTLEEGIFNLIIAAKNSGFRIIVITNQSGISRGFYGWPEYMKITERILQLLGEKHIFDAFYANGYSEISEVSKWRKPNTGMIRSAKSDLNIDIENSILIGDRVTDIEAGYNSGIENLYHVLTGHGKDERQKFNSDYFENKKKLILKKNEPLFNTTKINKFTSLTFIDDLKRFPLSVFIRIMNNFKNIT